MRRGQWKHDGMPRRRGRFNALGVFFIFSRPRLPLGALSPSYRTRHPGHNAAAVAELSSKTVLHGRKPAARWKSDDLRRRTGRCLAVSCANRERVGEETYAGKLSTCARLLLSNTDFFYECNDPRLRLSIEIVRRK